MDSVLKELMETASRRGSKYIKGTSSFDGLPQKMAELAVLLLDKAKRLPGLEEAKIREELIEVQNKVDDLRKSLFANKILPR